MKLSVCTICYNHEKFIAQALDSFLCQRVNFDFEIIVFDDASTDNTAAILKSYAERYPEKIKLHLRADNVGMIPNFVEAISSCKGQYVALCEGDDYWIDPLKLQLQVDLLDQNPDIAISFHRARLEFYGIEPFPFQDINSNTPTITGFGDLVNGNYIHTPTCVYRNKLFDRFPSSFLSLKLGDWPLHLLNAQFGKVHFMDREMAVYRIFKGGFWSVRAHYEKIEYTMYFLKRMQQYFGEAHRKQFDRSLRNYARVLLKLYFRHRLFGKLFRKGFTLLRLSFQ